MKCPLQKEENCIEGRCALWTIYYEGTKNYFDCAFVVAAQALKQIVERVNK